MKNVYVYVYPIEDFERNIPDNELIKAYCDGSVKRYSLDEFAELINDECFNEVNNWVRIIDDMSGYFPISYLHRDDLKGIGYDVSEVSDWDMETIAEKLGSDYTEQLFHSSLPIIVDHVGVPKINLVSFEVPRWKADLFISLFNADGGNGFEESEILEAEQFIEDNSLKLLVDVEDKPDQMIKCTFLTKL